MPPERPLQNLDDDILPETGTHSIDRAHALGRVLRHLGLPFRIVAAEGANYPDGSGRVPKGATFVTYDTGDVPAKVIWGRVDKIAPIPQVDRRK